MEEIKYKRKIEDLEIQLAEALKKPRMRCCNDKV
jgi:hypothetical protein